ncbi:MAG: hypothetical protein H8E26_01345 [FCB group bacterium]|nr:hypothetical protein [FCB group bacterium]MBL7123132.1 hypothetical protein [Candidatus Neomarinimicrobiota bacterium]
MSKPPAHLQDQSFATIPLITGLTWDHNTGPSVVELVETSSPSPGPEFRNHPFDYWIDLGS